jgi:Leucine-rich repeat (LRR) protein
MRKPFFSFIFLFFNLLIFAQPEIIEDLFPPSVPTGLRIASIDQNHVTLSWDASTDDSGNVKGYNIGTGQTLIAYTDKYSETNSYTINFDAAWQSLEGRYFIVAVNAEDYAGNKSELCQYIRVDIPPLRDTTPPSIPTGLRITSINQDRVTLAWDASTDDSGVVKGYNIGTGQTIIAYANLYSDTNSYTINFDAAWQSLEGRYFIVAVNAEDYAGNKSALCQYIRVDIPQNNAIPYTLIPDVNFERKLIELKLDSGEIDGKVPTQNISWVTSLYISSPYDYPDNLKIKDVTGIQDFKSLTVLYCDYNKITKLDVSQNKLLSYLSCAQNGLTELSVRENKALSYLYCVNNKLTELYVNENGSLEDLGCSSNKLTKLDVSQNKLLSYLDCGQNELTELSVRENKALRRLYCDYNKLTELNVNENGSLETLYCWNNKLTKLDVSQNKLLSYLNCGENKLTELSVRENKALSNLSCANNKLTELNVSENRSLENLNCGVNKLTSLDVSQCPNLDLLWVNHNELVHLDLSKNSNLTKLICSYNKLRSLNLKNGNNRNLDITRSYFFRNPDLRCIQVDDANYSNTNWSGLKDSTASYSENCGYLSPISKSAAGITIPSGEAQIFATGATLADVIIEGENIQWYAVNPATFGLASARKSANEPLPLTTVLENGKSYYATQTVNGVESDSYELEVVIEALSNESSFSLAFAKVYPNPTKERVMINHTSKIEAVAIYSTMGQKLLEVNPNINQAEVNMSSLKSGIYILQMVSGNEEKAIKIVKE